MEIYKLSDEAPDVGLTKKRKRDIMWKVASEDVGFLGGVSGRISDGVPSEMPGGSPAEMRITDIKQGVRDENRVNVYVNGKYSFSLDIAQVVELGVKIGRVISEDELEELKKASEFGKVYQRALEWVLMRPRSVRELRDYLRRREIQRSSSGALHRARRYGAQSFCSLPVGREDSSKDLCNFSEEIISRLVKKGYVDDERFAQYWVENRFVKKGVSEKRLRLELAQKGVAKETIDMVLAGSSRDDREEILKIIAKKRTKYDDGKLIQYLVRQGFDYGLSREIVESGSGE